MKKWHPETKNKGIFDNTQLIPSSRKSALDPGIHNPWIRKKVIRSPYPDACVKMATDPGSAALDPFKGLFNEK